MIKIFYLLLFICCTSWYSNQNVEKDKIFIPKKEPNDNFYRLKGKVAAIKEREYEPKIKGDSVTRGAKKSSESVTNYYAKFNEKGEITNISIYDEKDEEMAQVQYEFDSLGRYVKQNIFKKRIRIPDNETYEYIDASKLRVLYIHKERSYVSKDSSYYNDDNQIIKQSRYNYFDHGGTSSYTRIYQYNQDGLLLNIEETKNGNKSRITYNYNGQLLTQIKSDSLSFLNIYYDENNHLLKEESYDKGKIKKVRHYQCDKEGNWVTQIVYDSLNKPVKYYERIIKYY